MCINILNQPSVMVKVSIAQMEDVSSRERNAMARETVRTAQMRIDVVSKSRAERMRAEQNKHFLLVVSDIHPV